MGASFSFNKPVLEFKNDDITQQFTLTNNSIINKVKNITDDLTLLLNISEFNQDFAFLTESIKSYTSQKSKILSLIEEYAAILLENRVSDVAKYCDITKRKGNSIFLDEPDVCELLMLVGVFKIISPFLYSKEYKPYKEQIQELLDDIAKRFEVINKKLFQIIRSKSLRGSFDDKQFISFLKYAITYDYLILYNYSFITNVLLALYNWSEVNPVSYIVALVSENFSYLILTYSHLPIQYSTDEVLDISTDYIESISYEMILNNIYDKLNKDNIYINSFIYPSPLTEIIILPIMEYIINIPATYLRKKQPTDQLMLQYLFYKLLYKTDFAKHHKTSLDNLEKFFMYSFASYVSYNRILIPAYLDILKTDYRFYGLENKSLAIETLKPFSTFIYKANQLRHIVTGEPLIQSNIKNDPVLMKDLVKLFIYLTSDETKDIINQLKKEFIKFLGKVKIDKYTLEMFA